MVCEKVTARALWDSNGKMEREQTFNLKKKLTA
jgi:hypothetical protein